MVALNDFVIDNKMPFTAILGPCQIESKQHAEECNSEIKEICDAEVDWWDGQGKVRIIDTPGLNNTVLND